MRIEKEALLNKVATRVMVATANKAQPYVPLCNERTSQFNCWGFVAHAYKWHDELAWLGQNEMENYLSEHTEEVSKEATKIGDIVVYRATKQFEDYIQWGYEPNELVHTALLASPKSLVIHKPGSNALCVESIKGRRAYSLCDISYRRVIK